MKKGNKKLLVIVGPTATGKTKLAVKLASIFDGEIVSADSRQVYKGMDVGTGKDLDEYILKILNYKIQKINYHCIDVVSPKTDFNLAKYIKCASKAIKNIQQRGKLPILVGGTGLYAQAIVDGYSLNNVKPDKELRNSLKKKPIKELQKILKKLDPSFQSIIQNKRYLIRYIEIVKQTEKPLTETLQKKGSDYDCLLLGINLDREKINKKIDKRLVQRIENEGLIEEVERLHAEGISWRRLKSFGLEYKHTTYFVNGITLKDEFIDDLSTAIHQFAKRQMSWLRRWERQGRVINWIKNYSQAKKIVKHWL
ncbi:MAG: tRNA (adenosine(37)-N6)-dimethylallyltransferase MiaA [bacterium]|nr:tRNA (adenosine(37)-N6)-dimethylallyltransferase MiaA [bacterium]